MAYKVNEEAWEYQDRTDAEMAADISKDRNMLDFVAYNNNGYPFVTLAGIMKAANEEGMSVDECDVSEEEGIFSAFVKVKTKTREDGSFDSSFSSRDQSKQRSDGSPDPHARTICINVAIKNAFKNLLYGSPIIDEMMNEFLEKNPKPPQRTERVQNKSNGNGGNGKSKQQPKQQSTDGVKANDVETVPVDMAPGDKSDSEAWNEWKESIKNKPIADLMGACNEVFNASVKLIFDERGLSAKDATMDKFSTQAYNDDLQILFTQEQAVEWLEGMCLASEQEGWLWDWIVENTKEEEGSDEDKEDKQ